MPAKKPNKRKKAGDSAQHFKQQGQKEIVLIEKEPTATPADRKSGWKGHHHMAPGAVRALRSFGKGPNPYADSILSTIITAEDAFHAALMWNMLDRHCVFPAPSIEVPNVLSDFLSSNPPIPQISNLQNAPYSSGSTLWGTGRYEALTQRSVGRGNAARYIVTRGQIRTTMALSTDALTGKKEVWLAFDPTKYPPLAILDVDNRATPTVPTSAVDPNWTSDPFLVARNIQMEVITPPSDRAGKKKSYRGWDASLAWHVEDEKHLGAMPSAPAHTAFDTANVYMVGGSTMDIEWTNPTAYTSCAFRARDPTNINRRFVDGLYIESSALQDVPFTTPFVQARGATATSSSATWEGYTGPGDYNAAVTWANMDVINGALASNKPFIQVLLSSTTPGGAALEFSINCECWMATSSFVQPIAGSMPYQTVPFEVPMWREVGAFSGYIKGAYGSGVSTLERVSRAVEAMPASSQLLTSVASSSSPGEAVKRIEGLKPIVAKDPLNAGLFGLMQHGVQPVTARHNEAKNVGWYDKLKGFGQDVTKGVETANSILGPLFGAAMAVA